MKGMARLAAMSGAKGLIAAAAVAAALGVAGCGGDDEPEPSLPLEDAQTLLATLGEIQSNVEVGSCVVAREKVDELRTEIDQLSSEVDEDLRREMENGADQLEILVNDPDQCERPEEPEPTIETETEEEPEPTTTEQETEPETTTEETQPTTQTQPGGGGGTGGLGPGGGGQ